MQKYRKSLYEYGNWIVYNDKEVEINATVIPYENIGGFPSYEVSDEDNKKIHETFGLSKVFEFSASEPGSEENSDFVKVQIEGVDKQYWYQRMEKKLSIEIPGRG